MALAQIFKRTPDAVREAAADLNAAMAARAEVYRAQEVAQRAADDALATLPALEAELAAARNGRLAALRRGADDAELDSAHESIAAIERRIANVHARADALRDDGQPGEGALAHISRQESGALERLNRELAAQALANLSDDARQALRVFISCHESARTGYSWQAELLTAINAAHGRELIAREAQRAAGAKLL